MTTPFRVDAPLPEGTVVLEASAGTGKTYAIAGLAARFVGEGTPLSSIMIVTFSTMATQELRARVRDRLESVAEELQSALTDPHVDVRDRVTAALLAGPDPAAARERLTEALADFDEATIATTHEFCHRMLGGLGVLAPQPAHTQFVGELTDLAREVALDTWLDLCGDEPGRIALSPEESVALVKEVLRSDSVTLFPARGANAVSDLRTRFAHAARAEARRRKAARGLTTFDDMMGTLLTALRDDELGPTAACRLAARFPVVLIDEFQDTDPQQWEIIQRAFVDHGNRVFLIGDPKQAIYGFRGADVVSYLRAVDVAGKQFLQTNWRSDEALVTAVAGLISGLELGHPDIEVTPVEAHHAARRLRGCLPRWQAPVRIRRPDMVDGEDLPTAEPARERIRADLAEDIASLLTSDAEYFDGTGWRRVRASDIAVLVTTNAEGERQASALHEAGVPVVRIGASSVFTTQAAHDWLDLLTAIATPEPRLVRAVGLTSFHGWTSTDLAMADSAAMTSLGAKVRGWADTLDTAGMAGLAEATLGNPALTERLLSHEGGPRVLTDLRHVAEHLTRAAADGLGPRGLVDWLGERIAGAGRDDDEVSRRLESDEDAVSIMTIHRAKGLQFPFVYLPDVSLRWVQDVDKGKPLVVHDDSGDRILDVAGLKEPGRTDRFARRQADEGGESLRKLYVALTRATCAVTMWWYPTSRLLAPSPLHRILMAKACGDSSPALGYDPYAGLPTQLPAGVDVQSMPPVPTGVPTRPATAPEAVIDVRSFTRRIDHEWRRTSYSGLTAGVHGSAPMPEAPREVDEPVDGSGDEPGATGVPTSPATALTVPMAGLPGGTQFGTLVHAAFERLDPMAPDLPAEVTRVATEQLAHHPVPGLTVPVLTEALLPVLDTPLGPLAGGRRLRDIPVTDRLPELDFDMPLGSRSRHAFLRDVADLLADQLPPDDVLAAYPDALRAEGLGEQSLRGFLTGSIDALLRVDGRHLVVDYKTNRLAPPGVELTVAHYGRTAMADAMIASHYPLQALLYAVATHRFLRWRQRGYDPARHLGGVLYLFVRGMAGPAASVNDDIPGVFAWSPPPTLVVALSDLIGGRA